MNKIFENLKGISNNYKMAVDALPAKYEKDGASDHIFSDEVKAQRIVDRNERFNAEIDRLAAEAAQKAAPEIAKLRDMIQDYIATSTDANTFQILRGLLASGLELSEMEMKTFAAKGGYYVLRLLEKPSKGHINAPRLDAFEQDLRALESYFKELSAYRGGLVSIGKGGYYGQNAATGNVIVRGLLDSFDRKADEIAERMAVVKK